MADENKNAPEVFEIPDDIGDDTDMNAMLGGVEQIDEDGQPVSGVDVVATAGDTPAREVPDDHRFGFVTLIGPPNAGKSTLVNQLLGMKVAIVSAKPQTTRNRITGILTRPDAQVVFLDTPGVHQVRGRMNKFLLQSAWQAYNEADVAVVLLDADLYVKKPHLFEKEARPIIDGLTPAKSEAGGGASGGKPLVLAVNKVDRIGGKAKMLGFMQKVADIWPDVDIFPISAATGDGVEKLMDHILTHVPQSPPMFPEDQVSTLPVRFMAAETIREKLFEGLRQELPYTTAVEIEEWEEEGRLLRLGAIIWCARPGHKRIIIGKQGAGLKKIGSEARAELEELLDRTIYLQLWVKVREGWTEDSGFLRMLGLGE